MYKKQAYEIFFSATRAVQPQLLLPEYIYTQNGFLHLADQVFKIRDINKFIVIAAGKAAPGMAIVTEKQVGILISEGYCITKYGHSLPLKFLYTIEAAHPVPDHNSIKAGEIVLQAVSSLTVDDIVLVLLSGGASSLLADIPEGSTLEETKTIFTMLVNSGASIHEINIVRKHLSKIKGGQLAKAVYPAKLFTLIISDVVGDDLESIASGPTVSDSSTFDDAYRILQKYNIWTSTAETVRRYILRGVNQTIEDTPKPGAHFFNNTITKIIGSNILALNTAKQKAEQLGYHSFIWTDKLTGNADSEARKFVHFLQHYTGKKPACILMGGETTLKVSGPGKGGRNQHFVLSALNELLKNSLPGTDHDITILSAGTDGTDGPTDAAGALFNNKSLSTSPGMSEMIQEHLDRFDSYTYFDTMGGLVVTGPTQTNVMDVVVALIH